MAAPAYLTGRDAELAALTALLDEVGEGHARAAIVCGEAGIGKTSLVQELLSGARDRGFKTVWGRSWEGAGAAPFGPWEQVFGAWPPGGTAIRDRETPDARVGFFDSAGRSLRERARGAGLVVALDDLHAADESSLHLLRFLVRARSLSRLLIVGTYRIPALAHRTLLEDVSGHALTIRLTGLTPEEVASVLARADRPAGDAGPGEVHAVTGGNPFLVHEAAHLLTRSGAVLRTDARWLLAQRLDGLSGTVRSVLASAAVLGREFGLGPLSRLTGCPPDDTLEALGHASGSSIVDGVAPGRWSFRCALVREMLLDGLAPEERGRLHRRASEILEATAVAHHLFEAVLLGESVPAGEACAAAAAAAADSLAYEDAVLWFGRALEVDDRSGRQDGRRRYDLLVGLGNVLVELGMVPDAQNAFHRAIEVARALGSVELAAEAAVRIAPYAISDATVIGALDDALCDLPDDDSPLRAQVLVSFARVMQSSSVGGEVLRNVNRMGLAMARRLGDPLSLWATLWRWHQNGFNGIEPVDERLVVARELVAMAEEAGETERATLARSWLAVDLYEAGHLAAARAELGAVLRHADELRQPFLSWSALAFAAQVALFEGHLDEAEALARQAYEAGSECRTAGAGIVLRQQLSAVRRHQGRFDELERLDPGARAHLAAEGYDCRHNPLLVALANLGRADEARALVGRLLRNGVVETLFPVIVPEAERSTTGRLCCPVAMADVLWALDDVERAGPLYEMLLPSAERHVLVMEAESRGVCALYLGQLATLLGRFDQADAHFRMAHARHERIGARVWAAHGRLDHARMLLRRQGPDDGAAAVVLLSEARASYEAMKMDFYITRAGELLRTVR